MGGGGVPESIATEISNPLKTSAIWLIKVIIEP